MSHDCGAHDDNRDRVKNEAGSLLAAVVIPTCNRPEPLSKCLMALAAREADVQEKGCEVLVCDDGADSSTKTLIETRFQWVRYVSGPRRGPAANRNAGARAAKGRFLIFLDDDCEPTPGWLGAYLAAMQDGGRVYEGRTRADRPMVSPLDHAPVNENGGCLWSCNFAIRADLFWQVGGFDEAYPYAAMEDVDLAWRLKREGVEARFVPDAVVVHPVRRIRGTHESWRNWYSNCRYVYKRSGRELTIPKALLGAGVARFRRILRSPWHRDVPASCIFIVIEAIAIVLAIRKWRADRRAQG